MATVEKKPRKEEKPGGFTGFIANSYRKTMDASEQVSLAAVNLPYMFLEGMGVPEDKTQGMKNINARFIGGVYRGTDWLATRSARLYVAPFKLFGKAVKKVTGGTAGKKPAAKKAAPKKVEKKAEKKAAPKKAPKKAPKAKKEPPKVAARKPAPVEAETKKAA